MSAKLKTIAVLSRRNEQLEDALWALVEAIDEGREAGWPAQLVRRYEDALARAKETMP